MSDISNLRQARKRKRRAEADTAAQQNRARFGQSKAARTLADLTQRRADATHAGHKRAPPADSADRTDEG